MRRHGQLGSTLSRRDGDHRETVRVAIAGAQRGEQPESEEPRSILA
jgi:hypothetical protein